MRSAPRTVASYFVAAAVSALKNAKPEIVVEIIEDRATRLVDALKDGRLDVVVGPIYGDSVGNDLMEEFLFDSRLVVVTRPGHPLTRMKSITLADLTRYRYVGSAGDNTLSRQVQLILKTAKMAGFEYAVQTNSPQATKELIRHSKYFGLLPELHVEADVHARRLRVMKVKAAGNAWPFGVRWRRDNSASPAMDAFIVQLRAASKRLIGRS